MRKIVVPGELLSDKSPRGKDIIIENGKAYATVMGVYDDQKNSFMPLEGPWYPQSDDLVIGIVEEAKLTTSIVDMNSLYKGLLISKYSDTNMESGDIVEAIVRDVDETRTAVLQRPRKLFGGKIIDVKPTKVHRILGREDTMIRQIEQSTGATIKIGMNGRIWIKGGDVALASKAILQIEEEAHTSGLTERINKMLTEGKNNK
jgi:exosome complex component RRP4